MIKAKKYTNYYEMEECYTCELIDNHEICCYCCENFCEYCLGSCDFCRNAICFDCLRSCSYCEKVVCTTCLKHCTSCKKPVCKGCAKSSCDFCFVRDICNNCVRYVNTKSFIGHLFCISCKEMNVLMFGGL